MNALIARLFLAMFFLIALDPVEAAEMCVGKKDAKMQWIYLHGMDDPSISAQERDNRALMEKMSQSMNARVFMARGNSVCKGKVCWKQHSSQEVQETFDQIRANAKGCLDFAKPFGVIGFSNGGYLVSKISQYCLAPKPAWILAIGSAGKVGKEANLEACAPLSLLIGKRDMTREKTKIYFDSLRKAKLKVSLENFSGGHELIQSVLENAITNRSF